MERLGHVWHHLAPAPVCSSPPTAGPAAGGGGRRGFGSDADELGHLPTLTGAKTDRQQNGVDDTPRWAVLQRRLIDAIDGAVPQLVRQFSERGGAVYFAEDYDDLYEVCATWGLFYAIGGSEEVLDLALQQWNATTRISDQGIRHRLKHNKNVIKRRRIKGRHRLTMVG